MPAINEDDIHRLLSDSSEHDANNSSEMDIGLNLSPSDDVATTTVRRILGIPDKPQTQAQSLPTEYRTSSANASNTGVFHYPTTSNPLLTNPLHTNPQTFFTAKNPGYPPAPPRYPFLTPPPPIVNQNETNRLLATLIGKLDKGFQDLRLRNEPINPAVPPVRTNEVPPSFNINPRSQYTNEYVELLEERITNLSDQVTHLTNRLNTTEPVDQNSTHNENVALQSTPPQMEREFFGQK